MGESQSPDSPALPCPSLLRSPRPSVPHQLLVFLSLSFLFSPSLPSLPRKHPMEAKGPKFKGSLGYVRRTPFTLAFASARETS